MIRCEDTVISYKAFILLIFASFSLEISASNFLLTAGGGPSYLDKFVVNKQSEANGLPLLTSYGAFGFVFEGTMQVIGPVEFLGGLRYLIGSSNLQYQYTNEADQSDSGSMTNLSTTLQFFDLKAGARWHFFSLGKLSFFISGGVMAGLLSFQFNEDEYRRRNNFSDNGLKSDGDSAGSWGYFGNLGFQVIGQKMGFRMYYQYADSTTQEIETLNKKRLSLLQHQVSFNVFSKI